MRAAFGVCLCCALITACGSAGSRPAARTTATTTTTTARTAVAERVCAAAARGARRPSGRPIAVQVVGRDRADVRCRLTVHGLHVRLAARADAQAWLEWDTVQVHQVQAYGSGAVQDPREVAQLVLGHHDDLIGWIPAQHELFATNASETTGGSYFVATVSGDGSEKTEKALGVAIAVDVLTVAPKGLP